MEIEIKNKIKKVRIILCGPCCSGKDYLRSSIINLESKDKFKSEISFTTREKRFNEENGVDYHFISKSLFEKLVYNNYLYEYTVFGDNYYGCSKEAWESCNIFIRDRKSIDKLSLIERKESYIIYLNIDYKILRMRMKLLRKMSLININKRIDEDEKEFKDFKDYDLLINDEYFIVSNIIKEINKVFN